MLLILSVLFFYFTVSPHRWLIFFCFIPFLISLEKTPRPRASFILGYIFGIFYFGLASFWLLNVKWPIFVLAVLLQSLFMGFFALGFHRIVRTKKHLTLSWLFLPSLWVAVELLRSVGFLGLPTGLIGYQITPYLPLVQTASLVGVYGLSFFVFLINTFLFLVILLSFYSQVSEHSFCPFPQRDLQ